MIRRVQVEIKGQPGIRNRVNGPGKTRQQRFGYSIGKIKKEAVET